MSKVHKFIIFNISYFTLGIVSLFLVSDLTALLPLWLFLAFGNGTVGHRYLSHGSFEVHPWLHWPLMFWVTLTGYSTTMFWEIQHKHHHRNSDNDTDVHSPVNGFWQALFLWSFNPKRITSIFEDKVSLVNLTRSMRDPAIRFTTNYFIPINLIFLTTLAIINIEWLYCVAIAFCIEHLRLGLINTVTHIEGIPGNYRNHNTKDRSQNNIYLGLITLGFAWHNNHHASPKKLILTERWWELDPEGWLGKLLSLTSRGKHE